MRKQFIFQPKFLHRCPVLSVGPVVMTATAAHLAPGDKQNSGEDDDHFNKDLSLLVFFLIGSFTVSAC